MAAYFTGGPEIQPDGLHTLYLMNPSYTAYSNPPTASSVAPHQMILLNSLTPIPLHQQHHQQHFVGIPLHQGPIRPSPAGLSSAHHGLSPRLHHNLWGAADANPHNFEPQSGPTASPAQQGLSLSLTSSSPKQAPRAAAGMQSVLMGSKYLKAAQQLLDEVVRVQGEPNKDETVGPTSTVKTQKGSEGDGGGSSNGKNKAADDLTTAERQELQMKKVKLVNMLDEVEQRYRQYRQQMQMVGSSFEAVAGFGSARTYTALALHTISKQFRSLRDAISGQIRAIGKALGEEESGRSGGSRLRFVDHQLRQQRALQQLGMIQHSAWRPQRGLPERAVSVLRAWLFEHFLHPYPKDSDKHLLAKQTGLTRSQVSNWFINARVRLWKPMVEEMYLEETKQQQDHDDKSTTKSESGEHSVSKSTSLSKTERNDGLEPTQDTNLMSFESIMQQSFKKPRTNDSIHQSTIPNLMSMGMKPDELSNRELLMKIMDQGGGFGGYQLGEITRFEHEEFAPTFGSNGVSLTLGLPHCETLSLSGSQQPSYLSNEGNYFSLNSGSNNNGDDHNDPSTSHSPGGIYESIGIQNRKRFAAQPLPDYVA